MSDVTAEALSYSGLDVIVLVTAMCAALLLLAWAVIRPPGRYQARVVPHSGDRAMFLIKDMLDDQWARGEDGRLLEFEFWREARAHAKALNEGRAACQ